MESNNNSSTKVKKPFIAAGIFFIISLVFYGLYLYDVLPMAIEYNLIDWHFSLTVLDILVTITLAVACFMIAQDGKNINVLTIPAFAGLAVSAYTIISTISDLGVSSLDAYFVFRNVTSGLAYLFLGIYSINRGISIVFASIFSFYSSAFIIRFNIKQIMFLFEQNAEFSGMFAYSLLVVHTIGLLILIWSLCVVYPSKLDNKDIIKKNIALAIFVSVITLGIYAVIWVKSISDDISKMDGEESRSSLETAMFFTIPFYCMYWFYKKGKKLSVLADDADMSALYSVQGFFFLGLFALGLMQGQLHRAIGLHK